MRRFHVTLDHPEITHAYVLFALGDTDGTYRATVALEAGDQTSVVEFDPKVDPNYAVTHDARMAVKDALVSHYGASDIALSTRVSRWKVNEVPFPANVLSVFRGRFVVDTSLRLVRTVDCRRIDPTIGLPIGSDLWRALFPFAFKFRVDDVEIQVTPDSVCRRDKEGVPKYIRLVTHDLWACIIGRRLLGASIDLTEDTKE